MSLTDEVIAQVRLMEPDATTRWPDAFLIRIVRWADGLIKEEAPLYYASQDISLVDNTALYDLKEYAIQVVGVDWLQDGSTIDGPLYPTTFVELKAKSLSWHDDVGSEVEAYFLHSTPGIKSQAQVGIYPYIASVDSEVIRVYYQACISSLIIDEAIPYCDSLGIRDVYASLVLALLLPPYDGAMAQYYMGEYMKNVRRLRQRFQNNYPHLGEWSSRRGVLR